MYCAEEGIDPFSEEAIRQANPHFDDFMNKGEVFRQAEKAKRMPSSEAAYRNLILNQRVNMTDPFVSRTVWDANSDDPNPYAFEEFEVFAGLDLSARNDLTAFVAVCKDAEGKWHTDCTFFTPSVGIIERSHRYRVPYDVWAQKGFLQTTPGSSIDYGYVAEWLAEWCSTRNVRSIHFDRWRIDVFKAELSRIGAELPLMPFGQGFKDMTPALDVVESELANHNILHGGHPVLTMCAANAVATRDAAGGRKLDKSKATGRIDGMVALAMALGGAGQSQAEVKPQYEVRFF
jgi:phage terminase large subunit-like protein